MGYWRASIEYYYRQLNEHGYYLRRCHEILVNNIDTSRLKFLGTDLSQQEQVPQFDFLPICRGRCRMNVESYHQPFVFLIGSVLKAFPSTSLKESVLILLAVGRSLQSAVYSSIAIRQLLCHDGVISDKGWWLVKQLEHVDMCNHCWNWKPPIRMGKYCQLERPETKERKGKVVWHRHVWRKRDWSQAVDIVTEEIVKIRSSKSVSLAGYKRLLKTIQTIPSIGVLFANHVIGIASVVGIVPLELYSYIDGGASKFYTRLKREFPNEKLPPKEDVINNIRYMAEMVMDQHLSIRIGENISCKIGRILSSTDNRFWDIWEAMFPTFHVHYKGREVVTSIGTTTGSIYSYNNNVWSTTLELPNLITSKRVWMEFYK